MATFKELEEELEPYRNTLVLWDYFEVARLVDVIEDTDPLDGDYYWVYDTFKGIIHSSCVGGWIPLKGFIPDDRYNRLVSIWNLNNVEKAI
jgi:hypothetical protein